MPSLSALPITSSSVTSPVGASDPSGSSALADNGGVKSFRALVSIALACSLVSPGSDREAAVNVELLIFKRNDERQRLTVVGIQNDLSQFFRLLCIFLGFGGPCNSQQEGSNANTCHKANATR